MLSTVAPDASQVNCTRPRAAFHGAFVTHAGVSFFRAAPTKTAPSQRVNPGELSDFQFYTPSKSVGACLVVDVDRPDAVLEIFEAIPAEIHPSWVIETRRGAQAGWLIDPVDLRETAREHPIRYAQAVGHALRAAVSGDEAVDPLTPSRVRNPVYTHAELRAPATPPVYGLRQLHHALADAGLWTHGPRLNGRTIQHAAQAATAVIGEGNRNQTIFDVARHAAYRGEDYAAVAWETNDAADVPLPAAEVQGIIRSITRYISKVAKTPTAATVAMPSQMREALSEMGRRGGLANTAAQRAARALGTQASIAARKRRTNQKARMAQKLHARGHTRRHIAGKLGTSLPTLCRWLRRYIPHAPDFTNEPSGDRAGPPTSLEGVPRDPHGPQAGCPGRKSRRLTEYRPPARGPSPQCCTRHTETHDKNRPPRCPSPRTCYPGLLRRRHWGDARDR